MSKEFADLYSGHSAVYAKFRPTYPDEIYHEIKNFCKDKSIQTAVDIGCGTGQATKDLRKHFQCKVIGVEPSPQQLLEAYKEDGIDYVCAKAEETTLSDKSFDLLTVATAVHWFNIETFWKEVDRLLVSGGIVAIWTNGDTITRNEEADFHYNKFFDIIRPYWPPQSHTVWSKYKDIIIPFERTERKTIIVPRFMSLGSFIGYLSSWSPVQKYLPHNPNVLNELQRDMMHALKLKDASETITIYWEIILLLGQKP